MPYDPKNDYAVPEKFRPFQPTKDDPLCARCGWPKHHHFHGIGGLAFTGTHDRCEAFAAASPIIVNTRGRRANADDTPSTEESS